MAALSVILTILRVIGTVLLVILGVVLLLILLVLFCPVRYSINADIDEEGADGAGLKDRARANGRVTWLFHLIRVYFDYPPADGGIFGVKIAFFRLFPRKKKDSGESAEDRDGEARPDDWGDDDEVSADSDVASGTEDAPRTDVEEPEKLGEAEEIKTPEEPAGQEERAESEDEREQKKDKKPTIKERINDIRNKAEEALKKPEAAVKKIYYTISGACDKIEYVRATIQSECFERAKRLLFNEARRVIRHVLPRKTRVAVRFGADDPKKTADITAAVGALYPIFEDRIAFEPVFDEETLSGTVRISGRVVLVVIVFSALRLFLSRDIRRVYKRFKKLGK